MLDNILPRQEASEDKKFPKTGGSKGGYLRARVFLRLRCNRRTRFFFLAHM